MDALWSVISSDCGSNVPATAREPVSLLETHALLVAEGDHLDREGQRSPARVQRGHSLDRGDHAEIAVIVAGVAHGIDVRAEQQRRRPARPG